MYMTIKKKCITNFKMIREAYLFLLLFYFIYLYSKKKNASYPITNVNKKIVVYTFPLENLKKIYTFRGLYLA